MATPHPASVLAPFFQKHLFILRLCVTSHLLWYCDQRLLMSPDPHAPKTENLIDKCVCSDCSTHQPFPSLSLSSGLPPPYTATLKLGQSITPQRPLSVSSERRSHTSLTLNQKPEMIKLSEEASQKPRRAGSWASGTEQFTRLCMQRKSPRGMPRVLLGDHTNDRRAALSLICRT